MRRPTVYNFSNEMTQLKAPPRWILVTMVLVITLIVGINLIFTFLSFDDAVSYIVIFDFYVISGFMILGYVKVFYGFANIMLV
jgi:hypothetical protein